MKLDGVVESKMSRGDDKREKTDSERYSKVDDGGKNINDNDDEQLQGHVAIRTATQSPSKQLTPSSWALKRSPTHRRRNHLVDEDEKQNDVSSNPLPATTPNVSNLSSSHSLPRPGETTRPASTFEKRTGSHASKQRFTQFDEASSILPDMEEMSNKNDSFKGWLAENILDALNTAAGFTIATTGTILSPPIAMTKNVILPGLLAILVDTLDNITPPRIQDWFRIVSSSVFHMYSVLKSTEQGQKFRQQLLLVFQTLFEVWSAPESRQVVVDGMAAGVKLADALQ
jgi:hypothetical protein